MADVQLTVDPRLVTGKKVKARRREGIIPAHLYGRGTESQALQAPTQTITSLLRTAGRNAIIDLQINGESEPRPVVLRGVQRNPVTGELVHIDFFQISLTERLRAEVALVVTGEAPAVSVYSGVLLQGLDHLSVEALPTEVPQQIEVDVSGLDTLDSGLFVRDLNIPPNVEVLTDPDQLVAKVEPPRIAAEIEAEEAAAEEAAAEEAEAVAEEAEAVEGEEETKEQEEGAE
jgi:large subunit ribosomal protein L25